MLNHQQYSVSNVLTVANKARGMLYFIKKSLACLTKEAFVSLYNALVRPLLEYAIQANCPCLEKTIYHLERIQKAATRWAEDLKGFTYEERLKALNFPQKDLLLTIKIRYTQIDLEATQLSKFFRTLERRRSHLGLFHPTGRTRGRSSSFACRVCKY